MMILLVLKIDHVNTEYEHEEKPILIVFGYTPKYSAEVMFHRDLILVFLG